MEPKLFEYRDKGKYLVHALRKKGGPAQVTIVNYAADAGYFKRVAELFVVRERDLRVFNGGFVDFTGALSGESLAQGGSNRQSSIDNRHAQTN